MYQGLVFKFDLIIIYVLFFFFFCLYAEVPMFFNCELLINMVLLCLFFVLFILLYNYDYKVIFFTYFYMIKRDFILNCSFLSLGYKRALFSVYLFKLHFIKILLDICLYTSVWIFKKYVISYKSMVFITYKYVFSRTLQIFFSFTTAMLLIDQFSTPLFLSIFMKCVIYNQKHVQKIRLYCYSLIFDNFLPIFAYLKLDGLQHLLLLPVVVSPEGSN